MLTAILYALLFGAIWSINPNVELLSGNPKKWIQGMMHRMLFFVPIGILYFYFACPARILPIVVSEVMVAWTLSVIAASIERNYDARRISLPRVVLPFAFLVVGYILTWIACSPFGSSSTMHDMLGHGEVTRRTNLDDWKPVDQGKVVQVDVENAYFRGKQKFGDYREETLGSRFKLENMMNQKFGAAQKWIAPLEYLGFWEWTLAGYSPGYIMVDCQNPDAGADLVTEARGKKLSMRYMPSACYGDNLERHLYTNGYSGYWLSPHFEVDDEGYPMWVVTLTTTKNSFYIETIAGVLLVDPQTGEITPFMGTPKELELPPWVDRVEPGDLTVKYATWYGTYHQGWWAAIRGSNVSEPSDSMKVVMGSDGNMYFFSSMTSSSEHDRSAVSYLMVNSRTGEAFEYPASGPEESAICETINNNLKFRHFHATRPIIYNMYGRKVWAAPVDGEGHTFQGIAFVDLADTTRVAFGEDLGKALDSLQTLFANDHLSVTPGQAMEFKRLSFKVLRKGWILTGNQTSMSTAFHFIGEGYPNTVFEVAASLVGSSVTEVGDEVEVEVVEANEGVTRVRSFKNRSLPLRTAPKEMAK